MLIMGLGGFMTTWQRQTKDLGHTQGDKYSILLLDNRGMGQSDKPAWPRYTTTSMAADCVEVLDAVGWTEPRSVNVVGISLGGMISQELALQVPERLNSVMLVSTAPRLFNTVGFFENLWARAAMFFPKNPDEQLRNSKERLYSREYLESPDTTEHVVQAFPTHGDRHAAAELSKRSDTKQFTRHGFILQAIAAGWHTKNAAQLRQLAESVGRERIFVIHGDKDKMITFPHAELLVKELNDGAEPGRTIKHKFYPGQGHVIPIEKRQEFNELLIEHIKQSASLTS